MTSGKPYHFLFFLGHPAHFHMFRPMIGELRAQGHRVSIIVRPKDVLMDLLKSSGLPYLEVPGGSRRPGLRGIVANLRQKAACLYRYCKENPPDIMLGTSAEIAWVGRLMGIPSLVFSEDDAAVIPYFAWLAYPFASAVISPEGCNNGRWQKKTIAYPGYQKLAYLHPDRFIPDIRKVLKYIPENEPYSLLRFSGLLAHHDRNAGGFNTGVALKTIEILSEKGKVFISSEKPLDPVLEPYRLQIDPADMHHVLAHAALFAGDSQSMTVEAALLGVPAFRLSSFKGRISVLEELEHQYGLTRAFDPEHADLLLKALNDFTFSDENKEGLRKKREKLLAEKCDVTTFYLQTAFRFLEQ
jgi:predicted glycosyltransferase